MTRQLRGAAAVFDRITVRDLARRLDLSYSTVNYWHYSGNIPAWRVEEIAEAVSLPVEIVGYRPPRAKRAAPPPAKAG